MSAVQTYTPQEENQLIQVTQPAQEKIQNLLKLDSKKSFFRVYITGGGCSGFQYGFTFEKDPKDQDQLIETKGVKILIDFLSLQYLQGCTLDYQRELIGAKFNITNPQAKTTCSCGSSFSV